jgi:hypothetical protein
MIMELLELGGERVLRYAADGPPVDSDRAANDLIGEAWGWEATLVAVPVERLGPEFFRLRSGLAGAITQKFVNYRLKLAIIGDITEYVAVSDALRDWVGEYNRGSDLIFVPDFDALSARLVETANP